MAARTIARYQHDAALRELASTIMSCLPLSSLPEGEQSLFKAVASTSPIGVATRETIFHPQGGGQPSDRGTITSSSDPSVQLDVSLVRKLPSGLILHAGSPAGTCSSPSSSSTPTTPRGEPLFKENQPVILRIDGATRDYHSRLHTAGHLIGLAVRKLENLIGPVTELKANHAPGQAWVEFGGSIAGEHKAAIQTKVDEYVSQDREVAARWWDAETARARSMSGLDGVAELPEGEELFRVVEVEGLGAYPCGGTHLPRTGDIGTVVIRNIKRAKGNTKVSYEVEPGKGE
ncbi:putative alanyl-tRNA synthetase [Coniochaeta sp. 2T2.1]|nr:putative alanyl-tRNA synthetase [Coniochaeta sp. 2T2.1]